MGGIVASALANMRSAPSVTLLLRSQARVDEYNARGGTLTIRKPAFDSSLGRSTIDIKTVLSAMSAQTFGLPVASNTSHTSMHIDNLVVGTKIPQTIPALQQLHGNNGTTLDERSTILFLQNGMGLHDLVCEKVWPDVSKRPRMVFSASTHGVRKGEEGKEGNGWVFEHNGWGDLKVSEVPRGVPRGVTGKDNIEKTVDTEDNTLIRLLMDSGPALNAIPLAYPEFLIAQFEKLVINCCMNSISGLFNARNGEMFDLQGLDYLLLNIVSEAVEAFKIHFSETQTQTQTQQSLGRQEDGQLLNRLNEYYFHPQALVANLKSIIKRNQMATTSMVQDIAALRDTEIDSINGYIVDLAHRYGTKAPHNTMMVQLVKSKLSLDRARIRAKEGLEI